MTRPHPTPPLRGRLSGEDGAIPFVVVGVAALGGVLGAAWAGHEWATTLVHEAGGELTVWVLRGAFWALDLVALQASTAPVTDDWYTPVLEGPALPLYALAGLVTVGTLIAEVVAAMIVGDTTRIVQAIFRGLVAGMLATAGAALLLTIGGALSGVGRLALEASGTGVDAPLVPLQQVLMDTAQQRESSAELFIVFLAGVVIVFTSLAIYFTLAMRPVLLAALIVFLPVAHALSVWAPLRRIQLRAWALGLAVLVADAAILTMFAVTNTVTGQPQGVDRLIFGTFGLLLAALAPAALARIVGTPELHTAVQAMSGGSRVAAVGAGVVALKSVLLAGAATGGGGGPSGGGPSGGSPTPAGPAGGGPTGGRPNTGGFGAAGNGVAGDAPTRPMDSGAAGGSGGSSAASSTAQRGNAAAPGGQGGSGSGMASSVPTAQTGSQPAATTGPTVAAERGATSASGGVAGSVVRNSDAAPAQQRRPAAAPVATSVGGTATDGSASGSRAASGGWQSAVTRRPAGDRHG